MVNKKICSKCKQEKHFSEFYGNKTKGDGLQAYCKVCEKTAHPTWFNCENCSKNFSVNHRNISKRKTKLCPDCLIERNIERIITRNKNTKKEGPLIDNGYLYETLNGKVFYTHRTVMSNHLGRKLEKEEVVHHIDGNKLNNKLENLFLTDHRNHSLAHSSLDRIGYELIKKGLVTFNAEKSRYEKSEELEKILITR